ncbi:MAG: TlpA family protein disulfide reductase [Acidobacteria bacterium]|nr:TlpA family protein disulfide reductase [Acidobacteriota bacterium]MBW4044308.1 TlpA family protein disulfide reductase [Acidobacteriota bacterium]
MKRNQIVIAVMVCALALFMWSSWQIVKQRSVRPPAHVPVLTDSDAAPADGLPALRGRMSPAFTLRDLNGRKTSLSDYRGKAVLINFWATWCAPCGVELPWFVQLRKQYAAQGFEILGIDEDEPDDRKNVPAFSQKVGLNYPVLYSDDAVDKAYNCCDYYPMSIYVGRDGRVVEETGGLGTREEIEANIRKALSTPASAPS